MDTDGFTEIVGAAEALGCLEGWLLGMFDIEGFIECAQLGGDDGALDGCPETDGDSLGCDVGQLDKDGCREGWLLGMLDNEGFTEGLLEIEGYFDGEMLGF